MSTRDLHVDDVPEILHAALEDAAAKRRKDGSTNGDPRASKREFVIHALVAAINEDAWAKPAIPMFVPVGNDARLGGEIVGAIKVLADSDVNQHPAVIAAVARLRFAQRIVFDAQVGRMATVSGASVEQAHLRGAGSDKWGDD